MGFALNPKLKLPRVHRTEALMERTFSNRLGVELGVRVRDKGRVRVRHRVSSYISPIPPLYLPYISNRLGKGLSSRMTHAFSG